MRYLLMPLAAALLFSCCGTEPGQRTAAGNSGEARVSAPEGAMAAGEKMGADGMGSETTTPAATETPKQTNPKQKIAMSYNKLTDDEAYVIQQKGTEARFRGEYTDHKADGTYICRQCNAELYRSEDKFHSGCGWPSFDDEIEGAIERHEDTSHGMVRVEIVCSNCKGHLGHVFQGERMTEKNTRHCVNSISMRFVPAGETPPPMLIVKPK